MSAQAPVFDPEAVEITRHAMDRYVRRRKSKTPEESLRRLLRRVVEKGLMPQLVGECVRYCVGEVGLVLTADHAKLVTVYHRVPFPEPKKIPPAGRAGRSSRRRVRP